MSHDDENRRDIEVFSVSIPGNLSDEQLESLNAFFDAQRDAYNDEVDTVQTVLSALYGTRITLACANDVVYLRSRSRWTEHLEAELIKLHIAGNPPNICDWDH